jgi:hypothetical protein
MFLPKSISIEFCLGFMSRFNMDSFRAFEEPPYYHRFRASECRDGISVYSADSSDSTILHSFKSCDKSTLHIIGNCVVGGHEELVHIEINYLHFDFVQQDTCFQTIHAELVYECEQIICQDWMIVPDKCKGNVLVSTKMTQMFVDRCMEYIEQQKHNRVSQVIVNDLNDKIPIYPSCSQYLAKSNVCPFRRAWFPY